MTSSAYILKIDQANKKFFTTSEFASLLKVESQRTLEDLLRRLVDIKYLNKLERGKYMVSSTEVSDLEIAQFLYSPSYISFETALNYHGVLSQFPVEITSATTNRAVEKMVDEKLFTYSKINKNLFIGYYKVGDYLIASPEKALFDQLYMILKSYRSDGYLDEMDYSIINKSKVQIYVELVSKSNRRALYKLIDKIL